MSRSTSAIGRAVLIAREGCELQAYADTQGVWTIGVGHTGCTSPPAVTSGMTITRAEADAYLAADLAPIEAAVNAAVRVNIAQHQFDALVSFAFNVGIEGMASSTALRRLNAGDASGAADALLLWNKPLSILTRRQAEREQMLIAYETALPRPRDGEPPITMPGSHPDPKPPTPPAAASSAPTQTGFWARFWKTLTRKAA